MKGDLLDGVNLGFTSDDIKRQIRNSKTEAEKAIYYYFAIYLRGVEEEGTIKGLVHEALQSKSPEIQTMGIFLVEKLYRIPLPALIKKHPHKLVKDKLVIDMKDKEAWDINLEAEILGELGRIYFKLPIPTQAPAKKKPDEFLTDEGRIAQDKLAPFFGIPTPLKVEIVAMPQKKEDREHKFPHKLPAGTIWENFIIKFLNDENVFIQVKQYKHTASYREMGFVGKGNNPNPSEAWTFLKVLAQVNGELTLKDPKARDKYKKQKEFLAKSLKDYFSLDYDPFYPYRSSSVKSGNSYKIKITLIPPPADIQKSITNTDEEKDDLGLRDYLDEQAPQVYEDE